MWKWMRNKQTKQLKIYVDMSKSKKRNSCTLVPEINGKPSKLYKDMLEVLRIPRPIANLMYARYTASNIGAQMDAAGMTTKDSNGQHGAYDLAKYIGYFNYQGQYSNIHDIERKRGVVDQQDNRVNFDNSEDALRLADDINNDYEALVANVYQHGDKYQVVISQKDSRTLMQPVQVKERLQIWDVYKQFFRTHGIDLENLTIPAQVANRITAYNTNLVNELINIKSSPAKYLFSSDALKLFTLFSGIPQVQALLGPGGFSSLEEAAQAVSNINQNIGSYTPHQKVLLAAALRRTKNFPGMDLQALQAQVKQMSQQVILSSPEEPIRKELEDLHKKYRINTNDIHVVGEKIKTFTDAISRAIIDVTREIREIEKKEGFTARGKGLDQLRYKLMQDIQGKKYCLGIMKYLQEVKTHIEGDPQQGILGIDDIINSALQSGSEMEKAMSKAEKLKEAYDLIERFAPIITALADEDLIITESVDQATLNNIRQVSGDIQTLLTKQRKVILDATEGVMVDLLRNTVGETTPEGVAIINAVRMAAKDVNMMNRFLYSMGTSSNPIISSIGYIIQKAQMGRNKIMNEFDTRIRQATKELFEAGFKTDFMYEDESHIISDIDWSAYRKARKKAIETLKKSGLFGYDFRVALREWEDLNTEDRVVDQKSGRTERVPDARYRKGKDPVAGLAPAQKKYYDTMMQIKGEIDSLLPEYAQHHYLPPQLRRNMFDALGKARGVKDVWKALNNKGKDLFTVREDDENWASNGHTNVDGEDMLLADSDYDNTPQKQIPIFFVNRVEAGELLREFSSGLTALAGTAINYSAMESVVGTVEFMKDFVLRQYGRGKSALADTHMEGDTRVIVDLHNAAKNNNATAMVEGFVNQFLYGEKRKEEHKKWQKFVDNIIRYTSFKGLSTNYLGMTANALVGGLQMLIEAGAGEFYGGKSLLKAHGVLLGTGKITGEIWDMVMENKASMGTLLTEKYDPKSEEFMSRSHTRYHKNIIRKLLAHDLSFLGYGAGEYLIHAVNMYAILIENKVLLNGKEIPLYEAYEKVDRGNGVYELVLKQGVTQLDGSQVTEEYEDKIRRKIKYCNETCHGAMSQEQKGLIYQSMLGRMAMNFRQWMVGHYSRRFRGKYWDSRLQESREGYWTSVYHMLWNDARKDRFQGESLDKVKAVGGLMLDLFKFSLRITAAWPEMDSMQKANVKRAQSELMVLVGLMVASFALGEPDEHKKEFWRRFLIYQNRRMIMETQASMPNPKMLSNILTIVQSPIASTNTLNAFLYVYYGLFNGDVNEKLKSGPDKGKNKYVRNICKYVFPFYKDYQTIKNLPTKDNSFLIFEDSPRPK
mgnify:CR=1 FL=1